MALWALSDDGSLSSNLGGRQHLGSEPGRSCAGTRGPLLGVVLSYVNFGGTRDFALDLQRIGPHKSLIRPCILTFVRCEPCPPECWPNDTSDN